MPLTFDQLDCKVSEVVKKPLAEVTPADLQIIDQYLQRADMGVSQEMLDFISSPEQQAITRAMLNKHS